MATSARLILKTQAQRLTLYRRLRELGNYGRGSFSATFAALYRGFHKESSRLLTRGKWRYRRLAPLVIAAVLWGATVPARAPELGSPLWPKPATAARSAPSSETAAPTFTHYTAPARLLPLPVEPSPDLPSESATQTYWRGRKLIEDSKFGEAVKQFSKAVQLTPTFAMAFNARAYANIRLKHFREAVADLDHALDLNPSYVNAYQNRSVVRRILGDQTGADSDWAKARDLLAASGRLLISAASAIAGIWPVQGRVTSGFGRRMDPFSGEGAFHSGIDIGAQTGDPVRSTADGIVIHAGANMGGYGRLVVVDHGGSTQTWYAHLASVSVVVGQDVHRGQVIGTVGNSGRATAPHLHYEVRIGGVPRNAYQYLSRHNPTSGHNGDVPLAQTKPTPTPSSEDRL